MKYLQLIFLIFVDQFTKYWALTNLSVPQKITSFFQLKFVENSGIAFSIPIPRIFLLVLITAITACLLFHLITKKFTNLAQISLVLITAGAIGNLIDRLLNGKVIDFLSFWQFPIFNFADVFIFCGVAIYLFLEIFSVPKTR